MALFVPINGFTLLFTADLHQKEVQHDNEYVALLSTAFSTGSVVPILVDEEPFCVCNKNNDI